MLPDVVQSERKTNRADLCRPLFCFILIAGRIHIGQLTLLSLFFVCCLTVALRFMFVLDYVQHDVSKVVSNNIVCKTTNGEAERQRFAFYTGIFVYASPL